MSAIVIRDFPTELTGKVDSQLLRRLNQLFEMVYQLQQSPPSTPSPDVISSAVQRRLQQIGLINAFGTLLIGVPSTDSQISQLAASPGTGTVTSINGTGVNNVTVTGGPITGAGTLTITFSLTPAFTTVTVNGAKWSAGNGTPEGAVVGSVGDLFSRKDGGAGTCLYVKESGAATNVGWIGK